MARFKSVFEKLLNSYSTFAVIFLNTVILFALVNVACNGFLDYQKNLRKKAAKSTSPYKYTEYNEKLAEVYPDMTKEHVNQLLDETRHVTLGYDYFTQFKERPAIGKYVNADPRGFRPIGKQGPWPPEKEFYNVFMFGGSTTFGYGVADNQTIASHLQDLFDAHGETRVHVYNLGRCSYTSTQERILLEKLMVAGIVPNVAIFFDGLNDFAHYDGVPSFTKDLTEFMDRGEVSATYMALGELPVVKVFREFFPNNGAPSHRGQKEHKTESGGDAEAIVSDAIRRYRLNKRMVQALAAEFHFSALFVWQPTAVYKYDQKYNVFGGFDYSAFTPYVAPGYMAMARLHRTGTFGSDFLWLGDMQADLKKPLYADAFHYSAEMSKMIADRIYKSLVDRNLAAPQPAP